MFCDVILVIGRGWAAGVERGLSANRVGVEDEAEKQAKLIVETFKRENPGVERYAMLSLLRGGVWC